MIVISDMAVRSLRVFAAPIEIAFRRSMMATP
jgi:hypothetical protein